jgi:hypothetical protein
VTLVAALADLRTRLGLVEHALDDVLWAVAQGRPSNEPHQAMADRYETAAIDLLGLAHQAAATVPPDDPPPDLLHARRAVSACQELHTTLLERFYEEALAWREDRERLRRSGGPAWKTWLTGVDDALVPLPGHLHEVSRALLQVWQELVEWTSLFSVTLHALGRQDADVLPQQQRVFGSPQTGVDV